MRLLRLAKAVDEIRHTVETRRAKGTGSPYFVLFGAGLSSPPVPTASGIIQHCRARVADEGRDDDTTSASSPDIASDYSYWFEQAYPNPEERKDYLREQIGKGYISAANFRLAHLFLEGRLARIAVTPNFDDYFTRALRTFGKFPLVCDHPQTTERVRLDSADLQVIHLHGTYWYYDCCNLSSEIVNRATPSPESSSSMASILDAILRDHSPIVLGYSGWDTDVFMSALKRRLTRGLSHNMYWFCYRRESALTLPNWLVDRPDVRVVAPEEEQPAGNAPGSNRADAGRGTLPATQVLDALVKALRPPEPELTTNPLEFLARQLERELTGEGGESLADDRYSIRSVIARIRTAAPDIASFAQPQPLLEQVREAIRRADHKATIQLAERVNWRDIPQSDLIQMQSSVYAAALGLNDNSELELSAYRQAVAIGELLRRSGQLTSDAEDVDARSRLNAGFVLSFLRRSEEAIAVYNEVLLLYGRSTVPALQEQIAKALFNKGVSLGALNRNEEAIAVYEDVISEYGNSALTALQEQTANAFVNKGFSLASLNRNEEALAAYDETITRFGSSAVPALQEQTARAMVNKGVSLGALNRNEEAVAVYDDVIARFGKSSVIALEEQTAGAMFNKGVSLGALNRNEEAIAACDEMIGRYGNSTVPTMQERIAKAMVNKGVNLGALNRNEEAIAVYDDVIARYGGSQSSGLQEQTANALFNRGNRLGALNQNEGAIAIYDDVIAQFGSSPVPALQKLVAGAMFNKGIRLEALGQKEKASEMYAAMAARFELSTDPGAKDLARSAREQVNRLKQVVSASSISGT